MIPWSNVCRRCLSRERVSPPNSHGWCAECHAEVIAEIAARCAIPAGCVGPPAYAEYLDWVVVEKIGKKKLRVRLVSHVDASGLIPLCRVIEG